MNKTKGYSILNKNILIRGFLSNVASDRLHTKGTYLTKRKSDVMLHNTMILAIKKDLFVMREGKVKELKNFIIEGNTYMTESYIFCLLFPIDLILHNHISISKWKFA